MDVPQNNLVLSFTQAENLMGDLFQLRMDIVCYEKIATLIQMKEINESQLRSCPGSETHSYQQWQAMGACFRCIIPFRAWGVSQVHTHTEEYRCMIYKGADVVVFSSSPKSTIPLRVSAEAQ